MLEFPIKHTNHSLMIPFQKEETRPQEKVKGEEKTVIHEWPFRRALRNFEEGTTEEAGPPGMNLVIV